MESTVGDAKKDNEDDVLRYLFKKTVPVGPEPIYLVQFPSLQLFHFLNSSFVILLFGRYCLLSLQAESI